MSDTTSLLEAATECARRGEFAQARTHLNALLENEPQHELAIGMLAAVYVELREPERGLEYFQRVLDINPQNNLARFQLGLVQLHLQQAQAALDTWEMGEYGVDRYLLDYHRGLALLQLDRPKDALAMFEQARERMPVDHALYGQLVSLLIKLTH